MRTIGSALRPEIYVEVREGDALKTLSVLEGLLWPGMGGIELSVRHPSR